MENKKNGYADSLNMMLELLDYSVEATESGFQIYDEQCKTYLQHDDKDDDCSHIFTTAREVAERLRVQFEDVVGDSLCEGMDIHLEFDGVDVPTEDFTELDNFFKSRPDLTEVLQADGYGGDIAAVDCFVNHLDDIDIRDIAILPHTLTADDVWIDKSDCDAVMPSEKGDYDYDAHICATDRLYSALLLMAGEQPLDPEEDVRTIDIYVEVTDDKVSNVIMYSADDESREYSTKDKTLPDDIVSLVSDSVLEAVKEFQLSEKEASDIDK